MRKYAKSWVSSIFLGALALSFAVWGIADVFRGSPDNTVYTLGSTAIPVTMFARDYRNATRNAATVLPPDQARIVGQQVLDRMTATTALDAIAARLGLTASDGRVGQQIQAVPSFKSPAGDFDHDRFVKIIGDAGYSEQEFIDVSRKDVARGQMLRAVEGGFVMPPDYARAIYSFINESRAAEYVTLSPAQIGDIAPPSEAVLAAYVKAHPERFSTPDYREADVASISTDEVAATIPVTDKQIDSELADYRSDYIVDEKRELEQLTFKTEAEAIAAKAELTSGKSFETVAFAHKISAADYKIGILAKSDLAIDPARAEAAFTTPEGAISAPVKGNFAWVLIHVVKVTPGSAKSRDEIKLAVQRKLALAKMTDMANAFTDAIGGGATIDEAARKAGMKFVHIPAIDARGLAPDSSLVAAANNPELLAAIFKAEAGEDAGDPFPTTDGRFYYAVKVDGTTPPKPKPLDAVRAQATASWIAEQRAARLRAKATALAAKATADHSLAGVAASLGAPVQSSAALERGTDTGVFSKTVTRALFDAKPGTAIFSPAANGDYVIARISGVAHSAPPSTDPSYQRGVNQLGGEIASDITLSLAKAEQQRATLTVNQKLVDSTVGGNSAGP
jgi:peptidyl-prolyl cis-trans isomerase D